MEGLKFKISSALKDLIGKDLITNDSVAIFELVKNSYDAGAKNVRIVFQNIKPENKKNGARIFIIDDGKGMSLQDIKEKWLFVGYSDKKDKGKKNVRFDKKRLIAGAKGIGRFACDRLGQVLDMYAKTADESRINHVKVEWKKFESDQKNEFQIIPVEYESTTVTNSEVLKYIRDFKRGVILGLYGLNDEWTEEKLVGLKRYLQRLINPAQMQKGDEFNVELIAEEYLSEDKQKIRINEGLEKEDKRPEIPINGRIENVVFEKLGMKTTRISCEIDEDGKILRTKLIDKDKTVFSLEQKNTYNLLKNVKVLVFFLNRDAKSTFTRTMGIEPVNYGSIFLYKNSFRVHPCGDIGDDWLGLALRKAQGFARFLGPRDIIGRVEVNGNQKGLKEVSSRDGGLIKNESYDSLFNFITKEALRPLELFVVEGIDWGELDLESRITARNKVDFVKKIFGHLPEGSKAEIHKDILDIIKDKEVSKTPEIIKNVQRMSKFLPKKQKDYLHSQVESLRKTEKIKEAEIKSAEKALDVKEREAIFLSRAATTDTKIAAVMHTVGQATDSISGNLLKINELVRNGSDIATILPFIDNINMENDKVKTLVGYVGFAKFNMMVQKITKDVISYVEDYVEKVRALQLEGLALKVQTEGGSFSREFRPLELSIMIDNFISNSKKAGATRIWFFLKTVDNILQIYVSDNGKGVKKEDQTHLFTRGFTTTDGSGIGLYHIKKISESMNGKVEFLGNGVKGFAKGACFRVTIR